MLGSACKRGHKTSISALLDISPCNTLPTIFKIPAGETNNGLSDSAWTVDGNEGFVVIDRPPVFTVCIPEDIYDEPMMEPTNSLGEGLPVSSKCILPITFLVLF